MAGLTKTDKKALAQELIMNQIAKIGYGGEYEEFLEEIGDDAEATKILHDQMDRVARMFGFKKAWTF